MCELFLLTKTPGSEVDQLGLGEGGQGGQGEGQPGRGEGPSEGGLRDVGDQRDRQEEGERSE